MRDAPTADSRIHLAANLVVSLGAAAVAFYVIWAHTVWTVLWKVGTSGLTLLAAMMFAHRIAPMLTDGVVERLFGQKARPEQPPRDRPR